MTQPLFPSTIGAQSRSAELLTEKTVVRKTTVTPGPGAETRQRFRGGGGCFSQSVSTTHSAPPQGRTEVCH